MKRENTRKKYQLKNWLKAGMILLLVCLGGLYFFKTSERFQKNDEVKVTLKHDNFFDDSVAGILEDLDNEIGLPKKIYLVNHFNVTFYATGEIAAIDTFFYGEDENGETRTYLVDYNRKKSSKMTVYINNYAKTDYEEDMCLTPLFELLGNIKVKEPYLWNKLFGEKSLYQCRQPAGDKCGKYRYKWKFNFKQGGIWWRSYRFCSYIFYWWRRKYR